MHSVEVSAEAVIRRMREVVEAKTDAELAEQLGVKPATVSSWRQRDSVPYQAALSVGVSAGVSLEWLFLGTGEQRREFRAKGPVDYGILRAVILATEENPALLESRGIDSPNKKADFICTQYNGCAALLEDLTAASKLTRHEALHAIQKAIPNFLKVTDVIEFEPIPE